MEDDSNGPLSDAEVLDYLKNGVGAPIMAKFPDGNNGNITFTNKEGSKYLENKKSENDSYSSESDALVIDESYPKNQKALKKKLKSGSLVEESGDKNNEIVTHSNPFFNESLFELSQLHQKYQEGDLKDSADEVILEKNLKNKKGKVKPKAKLHEYAQYLGLQPAVQFKCSKCARSGFETLTALQDHIVECNEENVQEITESSTSSFKLTRKVFLCSACGTYYENCNLYTHMLEIHQRFICLYCLGMFSILEDLCQHLQSKHSLQPGYKNTPDDFFNTYNEPCYLVCCECNKLFSEQDNFFYHKCSKTVLKSKKTVKTQITPENHVTGETEAIEKDSPSLDTNMEQINKSTENVNGFDCHETMETHTENVMSNNKPSSQEFNDTVNKIDNNSQKSSEDDESLIDDSGNIENLGSEPLYDESKLELASDDIAEKEKLKEDSEEEMEEDRQDMSEEIHSEYNEQLETRKVPKLSLKLPKPNLYPDFAEESDDSEKLTMDQIESDNELENSKEDEMENNSPENESQDFQDQEGYEEENYEINEESEKEHEQDQDTAERECSSLHNPQLQIAGPDVQIVELELEQPLDKFDSRVLLQKCLKRTVQGCIYCNHARKIAVNGKQLALHCIAEHRFSAVVNSITAEELIPESFVNCLSESLDELGTSFFSLESSFSNEAVTFSHLFECFQCYFSTTVHKELYLHNRKFHSKNLLLCIMCKSNFFSYSELICHLCPGVYVLNYDLQFRCCMCVNDDLPSSFRLMVHLRKKHNVCDVCLEMCHTQYKLSNHVWKHKLHHFCYRCGIAYRNKPDITRHLFWKHGTESVLCKKCLQKKWPHVYHFCVPPTSFICDECGLNFTKAVSLKVHKRIHTDEKKHSCTFDGCQEKYISNKLRIKHERIHYDPPEEMKCEENLEGSEENPNEKLGNEKEEEEQGKEETPEEKPKPKIDVLDLPALNLSESDSSDSESENINHVAGEILTEECDQGHEINEDDNTLTNDNEIENEDQTDAEVGNINVEVPDQKQIDVPIEPTEDLDSSNSVIQNIWDNFKNYQASKEKLDNMFTESEKTEKQNEEASDVEISSEVFSLEVVLRDHDYCLAPEQTTDSTIIEMKPALTESVDHDYCSPKLEKTMEKPEPNIEPTEIEEIKTDQEQTKEENKSKPSSSSSSDSDSSSCSCGSNCSCSSSSGSSSSSSDSSGSDSSTEEGRKRQQLARKQRRKERAKKLKEQEKTTINKLNSVEKSNATPVPAPVSVETPIQESDLETTESETDEEFYDKAPQKLAKKILEEKRQQLLSIMGPNNAHKVPNGSFIESTSRPPTPPAGVEVEEEERKKKKSKSKKRKKHRSEKKENTIEESLPVTPLDVPIPPYYQQFHQTFNQQQSEPAPPISPISLTLSRNSPVTTPSVPNVPISSYPKVQTEPAVSKQESDVTLRASKRRRVPNKFYGYSSDEEQEKSHVAKWRKTELPLPKSPLTVPPITIKTTPQPPAPPPQVVEPISIRTGTHLSDFRVQRPRPRPSSIPPIKLLSRRGNDNDSASDSNDSSSEEQSILPQKPAHPQLYCYCRCPYDEVSEMIGCDASDCAIEWFHFECVGIMVPPKGQWFCPDCRKKKQQRREIFQHQQNRQYSLGSQQSI